MGLKSLSSKHTFLALASATLLLAPAFSQDSPTAKDRAPDSTASAPAPVKLYGRIDELSSGSGARLPLKMEALTPKRDASLDAQDSALTGKASQSFPVDYLGTWSGELTVHSFNYDKAFFSFDPSEAKKQAQLLQAGTKGNCSVTFFQGKNKQTEIQPCSVVFAPNTAGKVPSVQNTHLSVFSDNEVPFIYYLHLGDLSTGKGVTGNEISCQLMKNTLKELARGVMEQEVVTRDSDRNPISGKLKTGFSESVLRFTRVDSRQLYLQAASVSYGSDAKFQNKVILYGTLTRTGNH